MICNTRIEKAVKLLYRNEHSEIIKLLEDLQEECYKQTNRANGNNKPDTIKGAPRPKPAPRSRISDIEVILNDEDMQIIMDSLCYRRLRCLDKIDEGGVLTGLWSDRLSITEAAYKKINKKAAHISLPIVKWGV